MRQAVIVERAVIAAQYDGAGVRVEGVKQRGVVGHAGAAGEGRAAGGAVGIVGKESGMSNVEEAQRLIDALNRAGNRHAARYAAIPYSVARLADDTYLAKLERVLNKAHARLLRRWQAQVAREMNEYEAARLAKLLEVPSDGRRF